MLYSIALSRISTTALEKYGLAAHPFAKQCLLQSLTIDSVDPEKRSARMQEVEGGIGARGQQDERQVEQQ